MQTKKLFLCAVFLACPAVQSAPLLLSGEQDGLYEPREYIVTDSMFVPAGDTLTFTAGTLVRFAKYACLNVQGTLIARGGASGPIVFTSTADTAGGAPMPFDWNGIRVDRSGHLMLQKARVLYSTLGISADSAAMIELDSVMFYKNGTSSLSLGGRIIAIDEGTPVCWPLSCAKSQKAGSQSAISTKSHSWKLPVRIGLGTLAAAGIGAAIYTNDRVAYYGKRQFNPPPGESATDLNATGHRYEKMRLGTIVAAAVCGTGFVVTFFF